MPPRFPIVRPVVQLYRAAATLRMRPRSRGNFVQECNYVYAEAHGLGLVMDVFAPESGGNGLGILDIVSGGWFSDRVMLNEHIGLGIYDTFCARGYTVFAVSPGSITKFTGFQMVQHIHEALRYVKTHADEWGVAPERLGLMGASAGGHLAALAALEPRRARHTTRDPYRRVGSEVAAAALFFPPTDLLDYGGRLFEFVEMEGVPLDRLLFANGADGHTETEVREAMAALSPARRVRAPQGVPFLLIHGDADTVVPLGQSEKLAGALRNAGADVELVVRRGGGHPWPDIQVEISQAAGWFDKVLGNSAGA